MKRSVFVLIFCQIFLFRLSSQSTFPTNGAPYKPHTLYAFINANIYVDYETLIKNGVLLVKDGKVVSVAEKTNVPAHAVIFDLKGKYIYPSFIDLYSDYGLSAPVKPANRRGPQMESSVQGAFGWNQAIRS